MSPPPADRSSLRFPIVCLITDRKLAAGRSLEQVVAEAVGAGVTMVQLREKDLPTRDLLALATGLQEAIRGRALLVVNGRADVAFAARAAGVHLPADGLPTAGARAALGAAAIVGRSIHSVEEVPLHAGDALDYLEIGTIFPSRSHPGGTILGVDAIRSASGSRLPIVAVGGINEENAGDLVAAGAQGVAVISAILGSSDPGGAAQRLVESVGRAWRRRAGPSPQPSLRTTGSSRISQPQGLGRGAAG